MSLYYRNDANGGLLMPPGGNAGPSVDPLLAEATWLLRASTGTGENEGTAGAVLDASSAIFVDGSAETVAGFDGVTQSAATTPDAAALDLTGDFCIAVDVAAEWQPSIPCQIVSKVRADVDDAFCFGLGTSGSPFVEFTRDGETAHEAASFLISTGADVDVIYTGTERRQLILEFDADNGAGGWTASLYEGVPGASPTLVAEIVNTTGGAVTLLGTGGVLSVGKPVFGGVYRARVYSGRLSSPTLVADFYPDRDWTSGLTMTSATGEVWSNVVAVTTPGFVVVRVDDDPALDIAADGDATMAFRFTQRNIADVDGEVFTLVARNTGTIGVDGVGFQILDIKIAAFSADYAGLAIQDGVDFGGGVGAHWTAGEHTVVATIDRTADVMNVYVDGVVNAASPVDISAVGALDPAADLVLTAAAHHAAAKWDRVLTADEIAAVPYLLA